MSSLLLNNPTLILRKQYRNKRGRYAQRRKATLVDKLLVGGLIVVAGFIIANEAYNKAILPVVYVAHAEEPQPPQPVQIVVKKEWTEENIIEAIRKAFPEDPDTAVAIMMAEGNLNPKAYNPEWHKSCQGSFGLFQIACVHYNGDLDDLKDIELNIKIAHEIFKEQGWKPWGAYRNGSYKKYLK